MSLIDRGQYLRFLFSTPSIWFPLATVFITCLFHLRSVDSSIPRLLVLNVTVRGVSSRVCGYSIFFLVACVALMTLHFLGLNFSWHLSCHACSCIRSCTVVAPDNHVQTSLIYKSNSRSVDVVCSARSLMKIRKSSGPSTNLCGTPDFTDAGPNVSPSTTTIWVLPSKSDCIHPYRLPSMP